MKADTEIAQEYLDKMVETFNLLFKEHELFIIMSTKDQKKLTSFSTLPSNVVATQLVCVLQGLSNKDELPDTIDIRVEKHHVQ